MIAEKIWFCQQIPGIPKFTALGPLHLISRLVLTCSVSVLQTCSHLAENRKRGGGGCPRRSPATQARPGFRDQACQRVRPAVTLMLEVIRVWGIWGDDKSFADVCKKGEKNESMERLKM